MLHFQKFTLNSSLLPRTSNDQKHSMLLGNTFQPFNIRLKPVCYRYERFFTQQSQFQIMLISVKKTTYFAFSDQRKCTGLSSMRLAFDSVAYGNMFIYAYQSLSSI